MNYESIAQKAASKIAQYGSYIVIKRGGGEYDSENDTYTEGEQVATGSALQSSFSLHDIDGTNIKTGDIMLMASLDGAVQAGDKALYGGKVYTVVNASPLSPNGGVCIYWKLQCRGV